MPVAVIFSFAAVFFATGSNLTTRSAADLTNSSQFPADGDYRVIRRDASSRVWERTRLEPAPSGKMAPVSHRYTELATGLNYLRNGEWTESRAEIDLLPDGRAAATQGQHQCYFPADIYQGLIETVSADGRRLRSRPLGLSYGDGSNTVLIAELKDSAGRLVGANQIVYPDAFTGVKADLRYTYTIAGFEQDVILREQPPAAAGLGLNPQTARLQVLTEFMDTPEPVSAARFHDARAGLTDHQLAFGTLKMVQGRAFALGAGTAAGAPVFKSWNHLGSRTYLVEEVPLASIKSEIEQLPAPNTPLSFDGAADPALGKLAATRLLPPAPAANAVGPELHLARASNPEDTGLVLDYLTISYTDTQNGFTFRGDTTYFLSNAYFDDSGKDTIEGGTVIKFDNNSANINLTGPNVYFQTGPYRPAIFTAKDDNSVGETIAGSTGVPTGYYGSPNFAVNISYYNENLVLHDVRMSYLQTALALSVASASVADVQILNCRSGIKLGWDNLTLNNALFQNVNLPVGVSGGNPSLNGAFWTVHNCGSLAGGNFSQISLANSLLVGTTNLPAFATNNVAVLASDAGVFQTVGAGAHYLANGSPWRGAGATNINPSILTAMAARTTYPPVILSNTTVSAPASFVIQAPRNGGTPDLGYHYDALDYITDGVLVNGASLMITNGVAVACYNRTGITLENGAQVASVGTPVLPNWFVRYQSVQEQALSLGGTNPLPGQNISAVWSATGAPAGAFLFSHFAAPANGGPHFNSTGASAYGLLTVKNSEIWGGTNDFSGASPASTNTLVNNLFYRGTLYASNASAQAVLSFSNNLFLQSEITLVQPPAGSWTFFDNAADSSAIATNSVINNGYNAYLNCPYALPGAGNVVLATSLAYQSGPLGNFYQPPGSPLADAGSTTADQAGFFHFTTLTSEAKETNAVLDIGYHYVAVDGHGNPFDNNQDGIPDYLADANGDGLTDNGELPWMALPVFVNEATNQILYPGSNIVFSETVTGIDLEFQWYDNSMPLPGQTNATLVINNAQAADAGVYYLTVTNAAGSVTSSNASLIILTPPVIVTQPASQTILQTAIGTFNVSAAGLFLNYQWYSNSVPVPGATGPALAVSACATNSAPAYSVVVSNNAGAVTSSNAWLIVQPITSQPVIYASSGSFSDVSSAVAAARPGSLVLIPPGTYVWSQTLYLNGVSLRGCGTNQTIILDGVPPTLNSGTVINMSGGGNGVTELSNFQVAPDPTNWVTSYGGVIVASGNAATPWRIDHMFFNGLYSKVIVTYGTAMSVIDHNSFALNSVAVTAASYGDQYASYSLPATYGLSSSNVLYMEDNFFNNFGAIAQVCDGFGAARSVLRHNTIINGDCGDHGTETGGNVRSQRSMEVYCNNFIYPAGIANPNNAYFAMMMLRGGSAVVFSNTASGYTLLIAIRNYRNTDTFAGAYQPYGGANGLNPWDSNGPSLLLQGVHTGPNGANYLQVSGANWAINQWVGYTLTDTNSGLFSEVVSNNANTMYYLGAGIVHNAVMYFNTGDGFTVNQVYATIDQPGRGSGDLCQDNGYDANGNLIVINTTTGTPSWPHQVIEPLYFWGNILNGQPAEAGSPYPTIQEGRDFFNDTPKPGYTPFQYPHPLTLINVH